MKRLRFAIFATFIAFLSLPVLADAKPKEKPRKGRPADQERLDLKADFVADASMKIDGNIEEWRNRPEISFQTLLSGEYAYDWTGPKDLSATVKAQYGVERVYFLIQVKDNVIVKKRRQWGSDRVELWLRAEDGRGKSLASLRGLQFDLGPTVDDESVAVKWLRGGKRADGVEAKHYIGPDGYDIEIAIDYSALGATTMALDGRLRFCFLVRDWDQDDPNEEEASIGSCPINPKRSHSIKSSEMGSIDLKLADIVWENVLKSEPELAKKGPWIKTMGDVGGSPMPEIIAFAEDSLIVAGFGLGSANLSWSIIELASTGTDSVLSVKDVQGDKKKEIILTRHETCSNTSASMIKRSYVFSHDPEEGLKLITNYIDALYSTEDSNLSVTNSYTFTKSGIVQRLGAKSKSHLTDCTPQAGLEVLPFLKPEDGQKKRVISDYDI